MNTGEKARSHTICNAPFTLKPQVVDSVLLSSPETDANEFRVKCNWCMVRDVTRANRCFIPIQTNDMIDGETNPDILVYKTTKSMYFCGWCCALSMCKCIKPHLVHDVYGQAFRSKCPELSLVPDPRKVLDIFVPGSTVTRTKFKQIVDKIHRGYTYAAVQESNMVSSVTLLKLVDEQSIQQQRQESSMHASMASEISDLLDKSSSTHK